ncbi:MAG: hypothetical protein ACR2G6_15540 [Gemmatimonadaceae bacterium]
MTSPSLDGHLHHLCGGRYQSSAEPVTIRVSGMSATVNRVVLRCNKCEHEERTADHRDDAERIAWVAIRKTHGLLAPKEIRLLRQRLGLTHEQMGNLLYGTPKGIVEGWERGRYLQNQQVDEMLRSLENRETLERLAAKAGVALDGERSDQGAGGEGAGDQATREPLARGISDDGTSDQVTSD